MWNNKLSIFCIVLLVLTVACGENQEQRKLDRPGVRTIQAPLKVNMESRSAIYGETLKFSVEPVNPSLELEEVRVSIAESRQLLETNNTGVFAISSETTGGGKVKLRVDVRFSDGQSSLRYADFEVLAAEAPRMWNLEVVNRYPHDQGAFTQGLLLHNGYLYEGTGNMGESRIRKVDLKTGEVLMERANAPDIFGEGITIYNDKVYQITYKTARGFTYRLDDFEPLGEWTYNTLTGEGWGLTHNDSALIMSDGSANLYFYDPEDKMEVGRIRAFDHRGDVDRLNELEYHAGLIYANLYTSAEIVAIDARTGQVKHRYSARGIVSRDEQTPDMDVLNGIAINPANGHLLITGKYWKVLYEVRPVLPT